MVQYVGIIRFQYIMRDLDFQVNDGLVLPDKASLYLTAIEDAEYKDDKIECELIYFFCILQVNYIWFLTQFVDCIGSRLC